MNNKKLIMSQIDYINAVFSTIFTVVENHITDMAISINRNIVSYDLGLVDMIK